MKSAKKYILIGAILAALFAVFTVCAMLIDVAPIGPLDTTVGFATLNRAVFDALGTNALCYDISEILGLIALASVAVFAALGGLQLIRGRSLKKVDLDLYVLCGFYVAVVVCYVLFEVAVINYRPVLTDGAIEASYPSSHTLLTVCLMSAAILQLKKRIKQPHVRRISMAVCALIATATVVCRLLSGVHWLTDIIGGLLLSASLVCLYAAAVKWLDTKKQ